MSLSGLTGALGTPVFSAWFALSDTMSFTPVDSGASKAALYLETSNWDNWTDATVNVSADQVADLDAITGVYDGYTRTLQIDSGRTTDAEFSDGDMFGACFYIEDDSISCAYAAWDATSTAYTGTSCYKNLYGSNHGDIVGNSVSADATYCEDTTSVYDGLELHWNIDTPTATGFEAWLYQPKYSQSVSGNRRYGGRDNNSMILEVKADGTLGSVTMDTDWMSAVNGIAFAATAIAATTMLAF